MCIIPKTADSGPGIRGPLCLRVHLRGENVAVESVDVALKIESLCSYNSYKMWIVRIINMLQLVCRL